MSKPHAITMARRQAATSIDWLERTTFLLNPDPSVRKQLKRAGIITGVFAVLFAICSGPHNPISEWAQSRENREMRPAMESAMKTGNRAAGTWLATHFWQDYPGLLQKEADAGEPTAMYIMGLSLMQHPHAERFFMLDPSMTAAQIHATGIDLVRRAAASGNQDALLFAIRHGGM